MLWPFWAGGIALATVATLYLMTTGRGFGVSGLWSTFLDSAAFRARNARSNEESAPRRSFSAGMLPMVDSPPRAPLPKAPVGWNMAALFIVGVALGGAISALARGTFGTLALPARFVATFGSGPLAFVVLFVGGIFVGAGTRLAGGCTSGHGLVGTARLQPASIMSTMIFFGLAIVVATLVLK